MKKKIFTYSNWMKNSKFLWRLMWPVFTLMAIYVWITTDRAEYQTITEYLILLITSSMFPVMFFWLLYSWSDITIDETGLSVEFIHRHLFVKWADIKDIRYVGSSKFGVWLVIVKGNQLTLFHRTYSLVYGVSSLPGFIIHPQINSERELINEIKKRSSFSNIKPNEQ